MAGSLLIPHHLSNQVNTTLTITFAINVPKNFSNQKLGGIILDIILEDAWGKSITLLDSPLVICLAPPKETKSFKANPPCLSFYNEREAKWTCEDKCLTNPGNERSLLCGETEHLTNFALLLSGNEGGSDRRDPCNSSSMDHTLAWVSLGLVAGAIVIIALSVVIIELRARWQVHNFNTQLENKMKAGANF